VGRRTKLILAAIVLVGGVALALQYRQPGAEGTSDASPAKPFAAAHLAATDSTSNSVPIAPPPNSSAAPPATATTALASQTTVADGAGTPDLPHAYPGTTGGAVPNSDSIGSNPRLGSLSDADQGPTHKVADGDTLAELAKRYLGNAGRWSELYDYNRDVLTNPDLLPIGAELRIPVAPFHPAESEAAPRATAPTTDSPAARAVIQPIGAPSDQTAAGSRRYEGSQPAADLVPVSGSTAGGGNFAASASSPSAKLRRLPPVVPTGPSGRVLRVAPRTYVVQPGDTLNSIAEKLYGDGAREDLLRDANRNLVQGAQELRAGTVLVIPMSDR
jgi:nucleoid-associated protein YgaU